MGKGMSNVDVKRQFGEKSWPHRKVPVTKLDLDLKNSRFLRDANDQDEALRFMMEVSGKDCLALLKDIIELEQLNSSDLPIVVKKGNRYVVLEGNRRLTCLRIWRNPNLLKENDPILSNFRRAADRYIDAAEVNPPDKIEVAIAPTEREAHRWIDKKHGLGKDGTSTKEWEPFQKDRREARTDPANKSFSLAFYEFINEHYNKHPNIIEHLENIRQTQYTILSRVLSSDVIKNEFGILYNNGKVTLKYGRDETLPAIQRLLLDLSSRDVNSRTINDNAARDNYLNGLSDLWPDKTIVKSYPSSNASDTKPSSANSDQSSSKKDSNTSEGFQENSDHEKISGSQSPKTNQTHIFAGISVENFTPRIQRIVAQTSRLSVNKNTDIVAAMLRVILDLTCYQFLTTVYPNGNVANRLDKRIKDSILKILPDAKKDLGQIENTHPLHKIYHETTPNSIQLVQYAIHDGRSGRSPREVIILAERYEPLLVEMNKFLESYKNEKDED